MLEYVQLLKKVRILLNEFHFTLLKKGSNEKVTSGIVAINAWKAHFKKFR